MRVPKPTGEYAEQMLEPGGWPEADEDSFYDRALQYSQVLRKVTDVRDSTRLQQVEVFEGGVWSGGAANAASGALGTNLNEMGTLQDYLATVITWHRHIGGLIEQAKSDIGDNVDASQREIVVLENDTELTTEERQTAINLLVRQTHQANTSLVAETAEQVLESKNWRPPHNALEDLLRQVPPPTPEVPNLVLPTPGTPIPDIPAATPFEPVPANPYDPVGPGTPVTPVTPTPFDPTNPNPVTPVTPIPPLTPTNPVTPITPGPSLPPAPPSAPEIPVDPNQPVTPVIPGKPESDKKPVTPGAPVNPTPTPAPTPTPPPTPTPGGSTPLPAPGPGPAPVGPLPDAPSVPGDHGVSTPGGPGTDAPHVKPAAAVDAPAPPGQPAAPSGPAHRGDDGSPAMTPAAASGMPAAGRGSSGGLATGGASAGTQPNAGTSAPAGPARGAGGRAPLGAAGKAPAAATPRAASARTATPAARPVASLRDDDEKDKPSKDDVTALPSVPVSAARAARDAVAAASSGSKKDPLRLARRIAAALNAKDSAGGDAYGFFWITAVTTDGEIVVANSYGLAYIPEGVELPAQVFVASADRAVPVDERARSATYPVIAVQTWAAYHDFKLRAVIGTAEQLAGSDAGVVKILLEEDDIPDSGKMVGRPRLEVVDPSSAAQMAETDDLHLVDLLPPAPADANAPDDQRHMFWFDVMAPMTSTAVGREVAHLRAFRAYATHCRELALHQAYSATDPAAQRPLVTDFLYWKYVAELLTTALSATT